MAHPKRRSSNTRSALRRSHHFLVTPSMSQCSNCKTPLVPHRICPVCGYYRGKQVLTMKVKESKEKK